MGDISSDIESLDANKRKPATMTMQTEFEGSYRGASIYQQHGGNALPWTALIESEGTRAADTKRGLLALIDEALDNPTAIICQPPEFAPIPPLSAHEGSWIVTRKRDGEAREIFKGDRACIEGLPADAWEIVTIGAHLASINGKQ